MIITKTPLRISFTGGGTDLPAYYKQGYGAVVSAAINKYVYITMNKRFDELVEDIRNNDSSVFFIENFSNITSKSCTPAISKKFAIKNGLEKIGNKMAKYFE